MNTLWKSASASVLLSVIVIMNGCSAIGKRVVEQWCESAGVVLVGTADGPRIPVGLPESNRAWVSDFEQMIAETCQALGANARIHADPNGRAVVMYHSGKYGARFWTDWEAADEYVNLSGRIEEVEVLSPELLYVMESNPADGRRHQSLVNVRNGEALPLISFGIGQFRAIARAADDRVILLNPRESRLELRRIMDGRLGEAEIIELPTTHTWSSVFATPDASGAVIATYSDYAVAHVDFEGSVRMLVEYDADETRRDLRVPVQISPGMLMLRSAKADTWITMSIEGVTMGSIGSTVVPVDHRILDSTPDGAMVLSYRPRGKFGPPSAWFCWQFSDNKGSVKRSIELERERGARGEPHLVTIAFLAVRQHGENGDTHERIQLP
jgi:hypothetical protein